MKKAVWFFVGILLVSFVAMCTEAKAGEAITVRQAVEAIDKKDGEMMAFVGGLGQGSFMSYVVELSVAMDSVLAFRQASERCGQLDSMAVLLKVYSIPKLQDAPVALAVPAFIYGLCHARDVKS